MKLTELALKNYRNYALVTTNFPKMLTVFLGENAQGKTNLLESIYVLAMTKSHRTTNEKELIRWQEEQASITGIVEKKAGTVPLEVYISSKGRKTKVNHLEQKRLSSYLGQLNVVLFAPEDLSLVKGAPQVRRKFMDMELGQVDPIYLYTLVQYHTVLKQRNHYLKQLGTKQQTDLLYLDILTEQLVEFGSKLIATRLAFIQKLEYWANLIHQRISHGREQLTIQYVTNVPLERNAAQLEAIQAQFKSKLTEVKTREMAQLTTLIGPHRDDLIFQVNGQNIQVYGSQGQQRTTALSVKISEIDLMHEQTGEYPILLLDDVMSELDNARQIHLLETIEGKVQTFLTTTSLDHLTNNLSVEPDIFNVHQGEIERKVSI